MGVHYTSLHRGAVVSNAANQREAGQPRAQVIRPYVARLAVALLACIGIAVSVQPLLETQDDITTRTPAPRAATGRPL